MTVQLYYVNQLEEKQDSLVSYTNIQKVHRSEERLHNLSNILVFHHNFHFCSHLSPMFTETALKILHSNLHSVYLNDEERIIFEFIFKNGYTNYLHTPKELLTSEIQDLFDQDKDLPFIAVARINQMVMDQIIDNHYSNTTQSIPADLIENDEDQPIDTSLLIPIEDVFYSLEHDAELIPKLHLINDINDVEESVDVKSDAPIREETEIPIEAPPGMKYLLSVVQRHSDPARLKFIKNVISEATPSKSKWVILI